ncbi:MAG: AMP-binding protein [Granulosicoccus sp.]
MNAYIEKILENFRYHADDEFSVVGLEGETVTILWSDLENDCRAAVRCLNESSAKPNNQADSVVLIFLPHCAELFPCFLGSMLGGYVPSFMPCPSLKQDPDLYWKSHQELICKIKPAAIITNTEMLMQMKASNLDLCGAAVVLESDVKLCSEELIKSGSEAVEFSEQSGDAIALLQHSSGTTGLKKGVALSFDAIHRHAVAYGNSLAITKDDVIVSWLPLYHDMGLIACFVTPAYHATKTVQISAFDWLNRPNKLFKLIAEHNGTLCWLPNFAFEHLSNTLGRYASRFELSSMRAFINCSETCKARTFNRFATVFSVAGVRPEMLKSCYAMAEVVYGVTQAPLCPSNDRLTVDRRFLGAGDEIQLVDQSEFSSELISCGVPVDGVEVSIVDVNRQPVLDGSVGEIAIRSTYLFSGYNKDPERTSKNLIDGAYYTNDLGFLHDGNLYVLGRIDDLIIVNGRNLYAHEIEGLVSEVEGVKSGRAVAIPVFDELAGSDVLVLMAERAVNTTLSDREITNSIIVKIQSELDVVPGEVELTSVGSLVKTSSGKMSRKENKRRYLESLRQTDCRRAA